MFPGHGASRQAGYCSRGNPGRAARMLVQARRGSDCRQTLPEPREEEHARIGAARTQRGDVDRVDVETKVEGVVELLLAHRLLEVLVGRRDDAHIDRPGVCRRPPARWRSPRALEAAWPAPPPKPPQSRPRTAFRRRPRGTRRLGCLWRR